MSIQHDDPRITAYVLGELREHEAKQMQEEIERDPNLAREVEEMRAVTALMAAELPDEPVDALPQPRIARIEAKAAKGSWSVGAFLGRSALWMASATVLGAVLFVPLMTGTRYSRSSYELAPRLGSRLQRGSSGLGNVKYQGSKMVRPALNQLPAPDQVAAVYQPPLPPQPSLPVIPEPPLSGSMSRFTDPASSGSPESPQRAGFSTPEENVYQDSRVNPLSTFSIDVDTASYSIVRRMLQSNQRPPRDSIHLEELVNYFPYQYAGPEGTDPLSVHAEVTACPWNADHRLLRIGMKGRALVPGHRPRANLVFLVDVSGSMNSELRLPLVKAALRKLVERLSEADRVAIVVYAGNTGLALPSTSCERKDVILAAIDNLEAGGSTNGGAGIQLAYSVAAQNFIPNGANRVILTTDGDFNVGVTNRSDLVSLIQEKAKSGVFLTVLGFGMDNLQDAQLRELSDKGNGNYAYIDSMAEAMKVLGTQMDSTVVTVAKDVKLQVEFNPGQVASYRLVGYEKRMLAARDFKDDTKDAGELGAGHTVTAFYEIVPAAGSRMQNDVDPLRYQPVASPAASPASGSVASELATVKFRFKEPQGSTSRELQFHVQDSGSSFENASVDCRFAAAVASFAMILSDSKNRGTATLDSVEKIATGALGDDRDGIRREFLALVTQARPLVAH